jgi:hypothetical protein
MTERNASATARAKAGSPEGMTERNASTTARAEADSLRE